MKKTLMAAAAVALSLAAAPAFAQDAKEVQVYGSLGYSQIEDNTLSLGGAQVRLGAKVHKYFAIEAEGTIGIVDDSFAGFDVDLEHQVGIYAVAFMPVSEQVDLIARVGYSNMEIGVAGGSADDDSINYGIGMEYRFDEQNGIRGDYTYMDFDSGSADMWSIAYVRRF